MSPGPLKRFLFGCHLWLSARLLPLTIHGRSFEGVLRHTDIASTTLYDGLPVDYIARRVRRVVRRPWLMRDRRCLREGILGMRFLRQAGFKPELLFGVDPSSMGNDRLKAHCWVTLDGQPVVSDKLPGMVTIYRHAPDATP
jgi:hypothetical protein